MEIPKSNKLDKTHTGIKILLNLVPLGGGSLAEIFNVIIAPPIEKRRDEWYLEILVALEKLEKENKGIVNKLINNEEFCSLLISATLSAYKTHIKEKRVILKNALINSIKIEIDFDFKQIYLDFINDLTINHIQILEFIRNNEDKFKSANDYQIIYNAYYSICNIELELTSFRFLLKDLENKGLIFISEDISEIKDNVFESTHIITGEGEKTDLPFLKITPFGDNFLKFISDN